MALLFTDGIPRLASPPPRACFPASLLLPRLIFAARPPPRSYYPTSFCRPPPPRSCCPASRLAPAPRLDPTTPPRSYFPASCLSLSPPLPSPQEPETLGGERRPRGRGGRVRGAAADASGSRPSLPSRPVLRRPRPYWGVHLVYFPGAALPAPSARLGRWVFRRRRRRHYPDTPQAGASQESAGR